MPLAQQVLAINNDFPIRTHHPVHSGKVRAVYWLSKADSQRLIEEKNYQVPYQTELAVMIISDRLSAFDCLWHGENDLHGVPGKGAALNAISAHWFEQFKKHGLADSHLLDMPHPLVWIVQKAQPIKIEAIGRRYITGSLWRSYEKGERSFCGHSLPEGLHQHQALDELLVTPSTKGVLKNIPDVPELDDVSIVNQTVAKHYQAFGFKHEQDVEHYQGLLKAGFEIISDTLVKAGQILVDTKFEFGYVKDASGKDQLIYMDEVGTPDSSRFWEYKAYQDGKIIENSKEGFRQFLLNNVNDPDLLLNANRMDERANYAKDTALPTDIFMTVSETYRLMAEKITGQSITISANPREEIIETLHQYELLK